jgi:hypothetical protein
VSYPVAYTEPTTAIRDWLRAEATITAVVSDRTWAGGLPSTYTLPAIVIHRVGGGLDGPVDLGVYQLDCLASTSTGAATVANAVVSFLSSSSGRVALSSTLRFGGATVQAVTPIQGLDDPDIHRIMVTAQVVTLTEGA